MNEKIYKAMGSSAVSSLVIGICVLATGIAAGVLLIINGSRLLKHKSKFYYNTSNPENFFILRVFTLYCQPVRSPSLTFHFSMLK